MRNRIGCGVELFVGRHDPSTFCGPDELCGTCQNVTRGKTPLYQHDCMNSIYLGQHCYPGLVDGVRDFDLWFCAHEPTISARWSSEGADYFSGMAFGPILLRPTGTSSHLEKRDCHPMGEAYLRAAPYIERILRDFASLSRRHF